jgi:flagellar hook protein FlgE
MLAAMQTALQGIHRNQQGIQTAAFNIANMNTMGYRTRRTDDPAVPPAQGEPAEQTPSDVDLAAELVDLKIHAIGVRANATVIAIANRTLGELLDLLA